jgi:predicted ATPase
MAHDVFICHASQDKTVADAACAAFERAGIVCWIAPRDPLPGRPYGPQIIEAIEHARVVLLIFSGQANRSEHVARELEIAANAKKPIVPFRIEAVMPSGDLQYYITRVHWLDAMAPPMETRLSELVAVVQQLLEGGAARPAAPATPATLTTPATPATPAAAHTQSAIPTDSVEAPRHNLPAQLTPLIGRDEALAEIAALLERSRLVTLTGSGGIGKTRVSLQLGANLLDHFADGVWLVELAPISDPSLVATAVAQALSVRQSPDQPMLETLVGALTRKQVLLILDSCEHLLEPTARVLAVILHGCANVTVIASSRQALGIKGELTYRMPPLAVGNGASLAAADAIRYAAIALFVECARGVDARFALTDDTAPIVADICRRLDGIPLAIELAAARVKILSPQQLAQKLDERFRVLTGGDRSALPHHQTMRALIDWSHDLLDERERTLFRRLAIFVNGFTLEGAVTVGSGDDLDELDVFDVLASLVDKSLVVAEPHGNALRYRLLESTRAYAVEKLAAAGERELLANRHLRYLRDRFAELWEGREQTAQDAELAAALHTELEDVRAALDGALARSAVGDGGELLANVGANLEAIGLDAEGMARCEAYLAALPADESQLRARLSMVLASLLDASGHRLRAFELATQAVEQARASGDAAVLARALQRYASAAVFLQRFDDTETALTEAEAIPAPTARLRITLLGVRAQLSRIRGDLETAAHTFEQLRKENRALGNIRGEQNAALNLAEVEHARRETQHAIAILRETLPALRSGTDTNLLIMLLVNLAGYLAAVDDLPGAVAAAREAIEINAAREPDHAYVAVAIEHLALVFTLRGDRARAATLDGYADAALARHGFPREFTETTTHDRLTAFLRERLAPDELARLIAEGAALTPQAAIALALEEPEST